MTARELRTVGLDARKRSWLSSPGRSCEEWRSEDGTWRVVLHDTEAHPGEYRGELGDPLDSLERALDLAEAAESEAA